MSKQLFQGEGFSVAPEGMNSLRYIEKGRSAIVHGERLVGDGYASPDYVLYSDTVGWENDPEDQAPNQSDRTRIIDGVSRALRTWGVRFEIA